MSEAEFKKIKTSSTYYILGAAGVLCLVLSGFLLFATTHSDDWKQTSGTVVGSKAIMKDGRQAYRPIIEYTVNGQKYTTTSGYKDYKEPEIGAAEEMTYDPDQPKNATTVQSDNAAKVVWMIPGGIGVLLVAITSIVFLRSRNDTPSV